MRSTKFGVDNGAESKKKMSLFTDDYKRELHDIWQGKSAWNCRLARHTSLRVGGPADAILTADTVDQLAQLLKWLKGKGIPFRIFGRGSNILAPDEGLTGAVIMLGEDFKTINTTESRGDSHLLQVGSACFIRKLVGHCTEKGLSGLEFITGIPGTIGGILAMNGGAWGSEISQVTDSVSIMTAMGKIIDLRDGELSFSYRQMHIPDRAIILSGTFMLTGKDPRLIRSRCQKFINRRREKQPIRKPSAGSFFKNPPGQAAGYLIEQAGFKGKKVGGAMVSTQHANFLVNTGGATAADFMALAGMIQQRVKNKFGIMLEPEVCILQTSGKGDHNVQ